jgi:hypothetical protein
MSKLQRKAVVGGAFGRPAPTAGAPEPHDDQAPADGGQVTAAEPGPGDEGRPALRAVPRPTAATPDRDPGDSEHPSAATTTSTPADPASAPPARKVATQGAPRHVGPGSTRRRTGWARDAVSASTLSARRRSAADQWASTPVRYSLAVMNHYVSAALRQAPTDVETAVRWAEAYQEFLGLRSPATQGTKMPLEAGVAAAMQRLQAQLRVRARYGLLGHIQTWAVILLLADLDASDAGETDSSAALARLLDRLDPPSA